MEIHPRDAARLQIENGEMVEIRSRRGTGRFPALVTAAIDRGTVFVPMHWGELWAKDAEANLFTHDAACPRFITARTQGLCSATITSQIDRASLFNPIWSAEQGIEQIGSLWVMLSLALLFQYW